MRINFCKWYPGRVNITCSLSWFRKFLECVAPKNEVGRKMLEEMRYRFAQAEERYAADPDPAPREQAETEARERWTSIVEEMTQESSIEELLRRPEEPPEGW